MYFFAPEGFAAILRGDYMGAEERRNDVQRLLGG